MWRASVGCRGRAEAVAWGEVGSNAAFFPDAKFRKASCPIAEGVSQGSGWEVGVFWEGGGCCAPAAIVVLEVAAWGELPACWPILRFR